MDIRPKLQEIFKLSKQKQYNIAPISLEILSDFITPIETMRILKHVSSHCYMLESAIANEKWGRYTFLGFDPKMEVTCYNGIVTIEDKQIETNDPTGIIRDLLKRYQSPRFEDLPPFTGGLVGYFAYDYMTYNEPVLKRFEEDEYGFKDMDLMLFDKVIAFDHVKQKIILIVNMELDQGEDGYKKACLDLLELKDLLQNGTKEKNLDGKITGDIKPLFTKEEFVSKVEKAKNHIKEGDIFQIVLSNSLSAPYSGSLFQTYRLLRTINPSPYMFYFSGHDIEIAGASPETLVKMENRKVYTFPLAGTRKRGKDEEEDLMLEKELLDDEKELAEHNMLVDLGRNDIGKVAKFGTVKVQNFHSIQRFSHVMHIGSTVTGIVKDDKDALDAIEAILPAGTLSGAPKIKACQLIHELEDNRRGIYGGAIGYIDFTGNMDTCIAIRIIYKKKGRVFVRSGAGIVADSVPEKEYEECLNKARASLKALESQEVE